MKPRFKIGDILRYEDNDTIDIFKVSQIQIDKTTNAVQYVSIFQETFIDDGKGSLELYEGFDEITDKIEEAKGSNPLLDTPDKSVMPKHYNPLFNPTLDIPTTTTNCPSNNLPKHWEVLNM